MSTFNGIVGCFPLIRIDYFRTSPSHPPPLACFLSHVHSDHLCGLESLRSPYIYCSYATKKLLLRLEKYPNRINFSRGILESRKQHYKHLTKLLRTIPLECPTNIELGPKNKIRVTTFPANHCPGAVMFLIEGDGKAILYTGDIRAEYWWVNSIVRNPFLIPYASGFQRLDCLYLDTTFAVKNDIYREFPSKAKGLQELLVQVQQYPPSTIFYFRSWTLGYEDVWLALSSFLGSAIHVDDYQLGLYKSLSEKCEAEGAPAEASFLNGFKLGNKDQEGCLTKDRTARIHSCEPGTSCHDALSRDGRAVWLTPIITRTAEGMPVPEIGIGGGGGDLYQTGELETGDPSTMHRLEELCTNIIQDKQILEPVVRKLRAATHSREMKITLDGLEQQGEVTIQDLVALLACGEKTHDRFSADRNQPSNTVHFPYSRHSSYFELRHLVSAFRPRDVYACTVDEQSWSEDVSMESLFGDICSDSTFTHDREIRAVISERQQQGRSAPGKRKRNADSDSPATSDIEQSQKESYGVAEQPMDSPNALPILADAANSFSPTRRLTNQTADRSLFDGYERDSENAGRLPSPSCPPKQINKPNPARGTPSRLSRPATSPVPRPDYSPPPSLTRATARLRRIKEEYHHLTSENLDSPPPGVDRPLTASSDITLSTAVFDSSQPTVRTEEDVGLSSEELKARRDAYTAAREILEDGNSEGWIERAPLSTGNRHSEEEVEL